MVRDLAWEPFSGEEPPELDIVDHDVELDPGTDGALPSKMRGQPNFPKEVPHANPWYRQNFGDFEVTEEPMYHSGRKLRIIGTGAGVTGLHVAHKFSTSLENIELVLYEKNNAIGGTWLENRYPGCACDIPSHTYQFSWNRNPNWSSLYEVFDLLSTG